MKKLLLFVLGSVVLVAGLTACGPHRFSKEDSAEHAAWIVERVARKLDLDDAQKVRLDAVKTALLTVRDAAEKRRAADRQELTALLAQPTLDRTRANSLVTGHTRAIEQHAPQVIAAFGDFYDSLRPEQQQTLREQVESRLAGHCH